MGVVLETIQAGQDLTHARLDYLKTIAEFNKSQYLLSRVTGRIYNERELRRVKPTMAG